MRAWEAAAFLILLGLCVFLILYRGVV